MLGAARAASRPASAAAAASLPWRPLAFLCPSMATAPQQRRRRASTAAQVDTKPPPPSPIAGPSSQPAPPPHRLLFTSCVHQGNLWAARKALRGVAADRDDEITSEDWLCLFELSPRLQPYVTQLREQVETHLDVPSDLLRLCSQKRDVRASLTIVRLLGLPINLDTTSTHPLTLPRPSLYAPLAVLFSHLANPNLALRFYRLAEAALSPSSAREVAALEQACNAVIVACNRSGQEVEALRFASAVFGFPLLQGATCSPVQHPPSYLSTAFLLRSSSQLPPTQTLEVARRVLQAYFSSARHPDGPVRAAFSHLVFGLARSDPTGLVQRRFEELLSGGTSSEVHSRRLKALKAAYEAEGIPEKLRLHGRSGGKARQNLDGAQDKASLVSLPAPPNLAPTASPSSYAVRMRYHAVVEGDIDAALALYRDMLANGVAPNLLHVAPLVEGLAAQDRSDEAQRIMRGLQRRPTLRMYTAVIRSLARQRRWGDVREEVAQMEAQGLHMDDVLARIVTRGGALGEPSMRRSREVGVRASMLLETRGREAVELARRTPLSGIKLRFRDLTMAERHVEAQRVVHKALDAGVVADAKLRDAVRSSGARIRSLLRRIEAPEEPVVVVVEEHQGEAWQRAPQRAPTTTSSRPERTGSSAYLERALKAQRANVGRMREQAAQVGERRRGEEEWARRTAEELVDLATEAFVTGGMRERVHGEAKGKGATR